MKSWSYRSVGHNLSCEVSQLTQFILFMRVGVGGSYLTNFWMVKDERVFDDARLHLRVCASVNLNPDRVTSVSLICLANV